MAYNGPYQIKKKEVMSRIKMFPYICKTAESESLSALGLAGK